MPLNGTTPKFLLCSYHHHPTMLPPSPLPSYVVEGPLETHLLMMYQPPPKLRGFLMICLTPNNPNFTVSSSIFISSHSITFYSSQWEMKEKSTIIPLSPSSMEMPLLLSCLNPSYQKLLRSISHVRTFLFNRFS
jgi:hypothetical protein